MVEKMQVQPSVVVCHSGLLCVAESCDREHYPDIKAPLLICEGNGLVHHAESQGDVDREEVCSVYETVEESAQLAAAVGYPCHLTVRTVQYYRKQFEQYADHGVGHLQPANAALFCLDEYLKVASLAKERGLRISSGGITFENVALGACYGPEGFIEYHQPIMEVIAPYLSVSSRVEDGRFYLPEQPGIPMRMDFSHLEKDGLLGAREVFYR